MADERIGRRAGVATGAQESVAPGVRRRPAFRDADGSTYEADNALEAARASGRVSGDLRGTPAPDAPKDTYAGRRRAVESIRADRQPARDERLSSDRVFTEDRELTDDERVAMLSQGFYQVALPDLPPKPGYHRVWLTTTNPRDPVATRQRAGYRLLRPEDLGPGWGQQKVTSAEYAGSVMINEMIAAEIREDLYQRFMRALHHDLPRERERGIYGRMEQHNAALAEKGSRLIYEDEEENALLKMQRGNAPPSMFE